MKTFTITEQQAQAIMNYLICQPFKDVVQLIQILQTLQPMPLPAPDLKPDKQDKK